MSSRRREAVRADHTWARIDRVAVPRERPSMVSLRVCYQRMDEVGLENPRRVGQDVVCAS